MISHNTLALMNADDSDPEHPLLYLVRWSQDKRPRQRSFHKKEGALAFADHLEDLASSSGTSEKILFFRSQFSDTCTSGLWSTSEKRRRGVVPHRYVVRWRIGSRCNRSMLASYEEAVEFRRRLETQQRGCPPMSIDHYITYRVT